MNAILDWSEIHRFLQKIRNKIKIPAKYLRVVSNIYGFKNIIDHFKQEEGEKGPWQRRKYSTQELYAKIKAGKRKPPRGIARRAFDPANKILQLTGALRKSFLGADAKLYRKDAVILFSNVPYSGKHDRGEGRMPKRDFMWLSDRTHSNMLRALVEMIMED